MGIFNGKLYQTKVLAPLRRRWEESGEMPPPLARYGLDENDPLLSDDEALADRLEEVRAYWRNQEGNPRLGDFVKALQAAHSDAVALILDPGAREQTIQQERREREQEKHDSAARIAADLEHAGRDGVVSARDADRIRRTNGISPTELQQAAKDAGLVIEVGVEPTSKDVMAQIKKELKRLPTLLAQFDEQLSGCRSQPLSLYGYLGVPPEVEQDLLTKALKSRTSQQEQRGPDDLKTCLGNLNSRVRTELLDSERRRSYDAALIDEAARILVEQLAREVEDGRVRPAKYELLIEQAMNLGLAQSAAERAVAAAAREAEVNIEVSGDDPTYVRCAECQLTNPASARHCRECGAELHIECPSCGTDQSAAFSTCPECGGDLGARFMAIGLLSGAEVHMSRNRHFQALDHVDRARQIDADLPRLSDLHAALESRIAEAETVWTKAKELREGGLVIAGLDAMVELQSLCADYPGEPGLTASDLEEEFSRRTEESHKHLEEARAAADSAARERALASALSAAEDNEEAQAELAKIPPLPPVEPFAELGSGTITLQWRPSASPGPVRYNIRATVDENAPETISVGEPLLEHHAPGGSSVSYAVQAVRANVRSEYVEVDPIEAIYPVINVEADPGDGEIRLTWTSLPGQKIEVRHRSGGGAFGKPETPGSPPLKHEGLTNGEPVEYEFVGSYGPGLRSEPVVISSTPTARPTPTTGLEMEDRNDGTIVISWHPPKVGDVLVFRLGANHAPPSGEFPSNQLTALGKPLPAFSLGSAIDRSPLNNEVVRYVPVSVSGPFAVTGKTATYLGAPLVEDLQLVRENTNGRLTWRWPQGVREVRVVTGSGAFPASANDPGVTSQDVTLDEYQRRGGVTLEGLPPNAHISIFSAARIEGEPVFGGMAARISLTEASRKVAYSVRFPKRGKQVEASVDTEGDVPDLVLVCRSGSVPTDRSRADAELLHLSNLQRRLVADIREYQRPLFVRAFFDNPQDAEAFELVHPVERELRLT